MSVQIKIDKPLINNRDEDSPKKRKSEIKELTIEEKYQKMTHKEHALKLPDTYIGSVEVHEDYMWVITTDPADFEDMDINAKLNNDDDDNTSEFQDEEFTNQSNADDDETSTKSTSSASIKPRLVMKKIQYVPGLYKIYDEILVNAIDHWTRMGEAIRTQGLIKEGKAEETREITLTMKFRAMKNLWVNIDQENNTITVKNDGNGVPVEFHKGEKVYVPEMVFSHFLTSGNYEGEDVNKIKIIGGKNGYGAKLTALYSNLFIIETVDAINGKKYRQEFRDNLEDISAPEITDSNGALPYTMITFCPDLQRFGLESMTDDVVALFRKRVYDASGWLAGVNVFYNNEKLPIRDFNQYVDMYLGPRGKEGRKRVSVKVNDRWELCATVSEDHEFQQVSLVNGIITTKGGRHVNYVADQISRKLAKEISTEKNKISHKVVRSNLWLFLRCVIENPSFDSQTKEALTSQVSKFGSKCDIKDDDIKKIGRCGISARAKLLSDFKETQTTKISDGKKIGRVVIPKLDDAYHAGKALSHRCTLVLTEGDSAKGFATTGLNALTPDQQRFWGVFPLKGKPLNVRDAKQEQIDRNTEIYNIKKALGLKGGEDYSGEEGIKKLRYGRVMILSDQDSVSGDTPLLLKNPQTNSIFIDTIDNISDKWIKYDRKEQSDSSFLVWSDNGWTRIKQVIRHRVYKKMYRVLSHTGVVDCTEDHSLMDTFGNEISPKECQINETQLLHSFPATFENMIQTSNKPKITEDEAYLLGTFFSNSRNHPYLGSILNRVRNFVDDNNQMFYNHEKKKKVPNFIYNSKKSIRRSFFNGVCGYRNQDRNLKNTSINIDGKIGAMGIFYLARSLGYQVFVDIRNKKSQTYSLTIFQGVKQQKNANVVKNVINLGYRMEYVYDLETENHHFHAGVGQMIVHNTDGYHIKGLIINFIHKFWPSLVQNNNFICTMVTPIVKSWKERKVGKFRKERYDIHKFYSENEYLKWKKSNNDGKGYTIRYYKGLGTSADKHKEPEECFRDMKVITFQDEGETRDHLGRLVRPSDKIIDLAFLKKNADLRKNWLLKADLDKVEDYNVERETYSEFFNNRMIHFSWADTYRSIPNLCDGLKPSQRKVLYTVLKNNIRKAWKVAQLTGKVGNETCYHHGEASLEGTIVNLAQDYIGSNNINLLDPEGKFGTRRANGKDHASARYIFTKMEYLTPLIFKKDDEKLYKYLDDDGTMVEPEWYLPVVPMVLINGCLGIGTGFSTYVPPYNPLDLTNYLRRMLMGKSLPEVDPIPWFRGYQGKIIKNPKNNGYVMTANYKINKDRVFVSELPPNICFDDYVETMKQYLKPPENGKNPTLLHKILKDVVSDPRKCTVDFVFVNGGLNKLLNDGLEFLEKDLKLRSNLSCRNMVLFDPNLQIRKYDSVYEILKSYYDIRLEFYDRRRKLLIGEFQFLHDRLSAKLRFITEVMEETLPIFRKTKTQIIEMLEKAKYPRFGSKYMPDNGLIIKNEQIIQDDDDITSNDDTSPTAIDLDSKDSNSPTYNYLLSMPFSSACQEVYDRLSMERDQLVEKLNWINGETPQSLWLTDLEEFENEYHDWMKEWYQRNGLKSPRKKRVVKIKTGSLIRRESSAQDDEETNNEEDESTTTVEDN